MNNKRKIKVLSYMLTSILLFSGCTKEADCIIPVRHVHRYVKQEDDNLYIDAFFDSEKLELNDFKWTEQYIEINKSDEALYKMVTKNKLFYGTGVNWYYLYDQMASHHDYLEFYYYYTTIQTYITTDGKGHMTSHTQIVPHYGWTEDPEYSHNTGRMRICHHRYFGYQVVLENGKYVLKQSEPVDDIREIINDYPYFKEDCVTIVDKEYEYRPEDLKYLSVQDFDVFKGPDLSNDKTYVKKK